MKALVTGAAGFVGLHLAKRLEGDGADLDLADDYSRGVQDDEFTSLAGRPTVRVLDGDLRAPEATRAWRTDYDLIFHLAAIVGVARVESDPHEVLRANADALTAVLDFARSQAKPPRIVFASTSEVYAGTLEHYGLEVPTPETTPIALPDLTRPRTSYLLSKLHGEALVSSSGVPATIVRPHNVYGPRMGLAHVIPQLFERAHAASDGGTLSVRAVDHTRAFCFIDDAVEMLVRAATRASCEGETLNLGCDDEIAIGDLARKIVSVVGKELEIEALPAAPGDPERRCPSVERMAELTDFRARRSLDEGLARTWEWYREHVFDGGGASAR